MDERFTQVGSFAIYEPDTGEECWTFVRVGQGQVILALSRKAAGDIEVAFQKSDAERLLAILTQAIAAC